MNNLMTKSFLSYQDLKKQALKDLESGGGGDLSLTSSIEISSTASSHDANLRRFLDEANLIRDDMSSIRRILANLQSASDEAKAAHKPDHLKSLRARINSDILLVLRTAKSIRERLESMDRANAANRRLSTSCREGTPVDRSRTAVTNGLRKNLKELMLQFQDLRQRIMAEYKETIERRYFTVTGQVPEEEVIEKIIADGDSEEMLKKAMSMEKGRGEVLDTVREIQGRHEAAREIERSLLELHQVFLDMAVMVEAQGERMDDIEHHVMNAAHYVKDGAKELATAKEYQRSGRKWMCLGVLLLLILVLVIVIPIIASLKHS